MDKKILLLLLGAVALSLCFQSCSETTDEEVEFVDWQNTNETYFNDIYAQAVADETDNLDTIRSFALTYAVTPAKDDYIVVKKLESGDADGDSPMYTDSVKISYRGRLLPSTNYADGYVFDQTYDGDFSWEAAHTTSTYFNSFITGFTTALLNMRRGDYWRVYIPYKLGYGESGSSAIPGYSLLIFDISLHDFFRPDEDKWDSSTVYAKRQDAQSEQLLK